MTSFAALKRWGETQKYLKREARGKDNITRHREDTMKIVTIKEVSEFLKVKQSTLYSWVNQKRIPSFKINGLWRFDIEEIDRWVKQLKHSASGTENGVGKITKHQTLDIDRIVKKAIDATINKGYNSANGKPGRSQGLGKEKKENGTL